MVLKVQPLCEERHVVVKLVGGNAGINLRGAYAGMAEHAADTLDGHALRQGQRCKGVARAML